MTKLGPRGRPSAEESLSHFHNLLRQQRKTSLRWMLLEPDIKRSERVRRHLRSLTREIHRFVKNLYGTLQEFYSTVYCVDFFSKGGPRA